MPSISAGRIQSGTGAVSFSTSTTALSGSSAPTSSTTTSNTTLSLITPATGVALYDSLTQSTPTTNNVTLALRNLVAGSNISITDANGLITIGVAGGGSYNPASVAITGGSITLTGFLAESAGDSLTAHSGGGQSSATPLTLQFSRVTTVAAAGDSVKLPASTAGLEIIVTNSGANPMQVYGAGTDTINGVATATGVSQMQNSTVVYTCTTAGFWLASGLGSGFSTGSLPTVSYTNAITAGAAATQSTATLLTTCINRVTTGVATASVQLPVALAGLQVSVLCATGNSLNIYSNYAGGSPVDQINGGSATAAFALANNKTATFFCAVNGQWHALLGS